jgi:UDP:flavonoid glycosyltransferase YjiC (YdhE family)
VLVSLGTSAASGAGPAFATMADGLTRRGFRPLLLVGDRPNLTHVQHVPGAFAFAPIPSVVGRCAAAVVSGAIGTLSAALTAGIPVVVLPQLFDQAWHGKRVEDLGVGIMVTRPSKVPSAITALLDDPTYRQRANALAAKLEAEDGAAALVDAAEASI